MVEAASIAIDGEVSAMWKPNPTVRGTFTILYTCITTLIICVWSALHMDIPLRSSCWKSIFRKLRWMTLGLLAPELLLYIAFKQRRVAKYILQESKVSDTMHFPRQVPGISWYKKWYKKLLGRTPAYTQQELVAQPDEEQDMTLRVREHSWTLAHGFYACMGGYVFDFSSDNPNTPDLPFRGERFTITPHGVRFLMEYNPDLIPDISADSIADRNKANSLAKAILLVKVLWFCTSCASRYQQRLPLSLLEITTLAHGMCTLLTYAMWWDKPLDISEPTVIKGPEARDICALMTMCSQRCMYILGFYGISGGDVEMDHVDLESPSISIMGERPPLTILRRLLYGSQRPWYVRASPGAAAEPDKDDRPRWKHARGAMDQYLSGKCPDRKWYKYALVERHPSFGTSVCSEISESNDQRIDTITSICLPVGYALPHFLGWKSHFPPGIERILWRTAITTMIGYGIVIGMVTFFRKRMALRLNSALHVAAAALYVLSSMYIVVESFRQLLYLPPKAYDLPSSKLTNH